MSFLKLIFKKLFAGIDRDLNKSAFTLIMMGIYGSKI